MFNNSWRPRRINTSRRLGSAIRNSCRTAKSTCLLQGASANRLTRPMEDSTTLLRKLVEQHPEKLWPLCKANGLPYFRVREFMAGTGPGLRLEVADKLSNIVAGVPVNKLSERKEVA